MLKINTSNEYQVALSMYKDSKHIFDKILGEMYNFWEDQGYDVDIYFIEDYQKIKVKYRDDEIDDKNILSFCIRFKLSLIKISRTVDKDTMIGDYTQVIYYYFKGE